MPKNTKNNRKPNNCSPVKSMQKFLVPWPNGGAIWFSNLCMSSHSVSYLFSVITKNLSDDRIYFSTTSSWRDWASKPICPEKHFDHCVILYNNNHVSYNNLEVCYLAFCKKQFYGRSFCVISMSVCTRNFCRTSLDETGLSEESVFTVFY